MLLKFTFNRILMGESLSSLLSSCIFHIIWASKTDGEQSQEREREREKDRVVNDGDRNGQFVPVVNSSLFRLLLLRALKSPVR